MKNCRLPFLWHFSDLTARTGDVRSLEQSGLCRNGSSICQGVQSKIGHQQPVAGTPMQKPPLDPDVADTAPSDSVLTTYDEEHVITYLRLLDADAQGADWREVARVVLHIDPNMNLIAPGGRSTAIYRAPNG